jgi:hypothetical protein
MTNAAAPCPNEANHTPHPKGYVAHSNWADDAMLVADQQRCDGCGRHEIWVPKRPDLRIAANWPPGTCDWGGCDDDGVAERYCPEVQLSDTDDTRPGTWLAVCRRHTGLRPRRASPGRGTCVGCDREYALTLGGLIRAHDHGVNRCVGSWRAPREVTT